jgi:hypothetical protein
MSSGRQMIKEPDFVSLDADIHDMVGCSALQLDDESIDSNDYRVLSDEEEIESNELGAKFLPLEMNKKRVESPMSVNSLLSVDMRQRVV